MRFIELFAGIGGMGYGLMQAGMECVGYCEIDKYAHQAYQLLHDPEERMWSAYDVRSVTDDDIRRLGRERGPIQLIAGGFPCQSFSIAGKREGFEDTTRGTLFFEIIRFASILRPEYLLLENVTGLLSHDGGATFETIIGTLDELGYVGEWFVLNSASYVPQNRERVFIVASLGGIGAGKVFPFGRENSNAIEIVGRIDCKGDDYIKRVYGIGGVAPCLPTMQGGGQEPKILDDQGRTTKRNVLTDIAPTLRAQSHGNEPKVVVVGNVNPSGNGSHKPTQYSLDGEGIAYCLDAGYQKGINDNPNIKSRRTLVVEEPRAVLTKEPGEPMFTLTAQDLHGVVINEPSGIYTNSSPDFLRPPLTGLSRTLKGNQHDAGVIDQHYRIRKLTPLECFRLQSYPDWWYVRLKLFQHPKYIEQVDMSRNDITAQVLGMLQAHKVKEGISDSQLYKMAGNGVTSIVAYEIGIRLMNS